MARGAAKRYAQAVLSLAKERGTLDAWQADLAGLSELMSDPGAASYFASPNATEAHKMELLDQVLVNGQPEAKNLARLLLERDRLDDLPAIHKLFEDGIRAERGIVVAEVTTAEPLGAAEQALVKERLAAMTGKQIELRLTVDPEIIGGIIARIGDVLVDGSVLSRLRRLRTRLAATG
ncbi:MAG: F0F1 ATP synthase subunit delta [Chloroflexota bacterium]|nr:F0F1 ATP synthase subunit delta [Chloroflexota bacterium]